MPPLFLSLEEVLRIHRDQLDRYGGDEGLRDMGLLQSALAMSESRMGGAYFHGDLYEMAAAYLFHLVQNHPFIDGNKRVGLAAALVFLQLNEIEIDAPDARLVELVLGVTSGAVSKADVAAFFREHAEGD